METNIDYITITTTGNAADFGDLTLGRGNLGACASTTRGVFGGGYKSGDPAWTNIIDYITINNLGNASDFGDLGTARYSDNGFSNSTRGLFIGGYNSTDGYMVSMEYVTIASTGNSSSFGNLTNSCANASTFASTTRGVRAGGYQTDATQQVTTIDYVTLSTTGNASSFGSLTSARCYLSGCSNSTRGVSFGGFTYSPSTAVINVIDYVTIASTGNATDFGDLSVSRYSNAACSNSTRGICAGGYGTVPYPNGSFQNVIDYITFDTTGNTTDFGDLTSSKNSLAGCSNCHGGL